MPAANFVEEATHELRVMKRVGLLEHTGGGNLGDDATVTAVMQNVKRRWPGTTLLGFSMNPKDTAARHGILAYPIRRHTWEVQSPVPSRASSYKQSIKSFVMKSPFCWAVLKGLYTLTIRGPRNLFQEAVFLRRSRRVMASLDLFIISGGGQLLDSWGGPWEFPYTILKWVVLARLCNVACYFLNVGAGPIEHRLSKYFIRSALALATYISFRDEKSRILVESLGSTSTAEVAADNVYSLDLSPCQTGHVLVSQHQPTVGLSPIAYRDPRIYYDKDRTAYETFLKKLAVFSAWLGRNSYRVALFTTDIWFDAATMEDLSAAIRGMEVSASDEWMAREEVTNTEELLYGMSSMDYVITCRFHGVIFAHLMNIPVLAIAHHPKVSALMADLGLGEYCVDIDNFGVDEVIDRFQQLVTNREAIKVQMAARSGLYREKLKQQFDGLFASCVVH